MCNTLISIIMPTYNSEATIKYSLDSIKEQTINSEILECLVIDGGSSDSTLQIASEYPFVKILNNEQKLPEFAKLIGFNAAKGKYIIKMDSDESFANRDSLKKRIKAFESFPDSHILVADELRPTGRGVSNGYLNYCGDPFSYFIYKPKRTILETYQSNITQKNDSICLLEFQENEARPIADSGTTTFDRDFILKQFDKDEIDVAFIASISDKIFDITDNCLCIADDAVNHRSNGELSKYLKKIKFRIINNIFSPAESGFSNRKISANSKKFLFPFYVLSLFFPVIDAITLILKYKDIRFALHPVYCYYTLILIVWYYFLKLFNVNKNNKEY